MYKELLAQMEEMGGVFKTKPISEASLTQTCEDLNSFHLSLPEEYADFLGITNGLYWGGLEFFGSSIVVDKKNGFSITDLISQNRIYQALNPGVQKVFLGRSDEENFLYNETDKKFEIVDEFSGELVKSFPLFEALFDYIVSEQIELIQNYVGFNEDDIRDEKTDADF